MQQVTIVGSGFAALTAVRRLRKLSSTLTIQLVSPRPELIYLPGLIWVPGGLRSEADLTINLRAFLKRQRVQYLAAAATGLSADGRVLETTAGPVENDGLIVASGGTFLKKLPGIEHAITPCEGIIAAERIRNRVAMLETGTIAVGFASNPNEPQAMRGGPMFEFLFGLDELLRAEGRRDRIKLKFFSPAPQPGQRLGPKAFTGLIREMERRGIGYCVGEKLKGFTERSVITEAREFPADLILFMPGMTGNPWFDRASLPRSPGGLIAADAHCRVSGPERVYVAGDSGSFPGPEWLPKQAHMADLQARVAATNLWREMSGKPATATFRPELICIVDSYNKGMLVARTRRFHLLLPSLRIMHWLKRGFEWWYLRAYRR